MNVAGYEVGVGDAAVVIVGDREDLGVLGRRGMEVYLSPSSFSSTDVGSENLLGGDDEEVEVEEEDGEGEDDPRSEKACQIMSLGAVWR